MRRAAAPGSYQPTVQSYLSKADQWADNAMGGAERPDEQTAAAIFAQIATAKAIAALAMAVSEIAAAIKTSTPT